MYSQVWLENDDVTLYLILPHAVTTYTIDMSYDNVCFVLYKQHKSLWSALHIGHSEEEVCFCKFSVNPAFRPEVYSEVCPEVCSEVFSLEFLFVSSIKVDLALKFTYCYMEDI